MIKPMDSNIIMIILIFHNDKNIVSKILNIKTKYTNLVGERRDVYESY